MTRKKILLNAFNMNSIGHIHHGMWTHPRDQSDRYNTIEYWTHIARVLERGFFDGLFIADIIGYYDVFEGNVDLTLKEAIQLPVNDPWTLVSAMAAVTEHLGFGVTANIHTETPYSFARKVSSLDHLTRGRLGWNVVTGYLDSGARAMGRDGLDEHDKRYDRADDFLQLCYKLWEGSWEDGAIIRDRNGRIYTDPNKVHAIAHNGPYYRAHGYHSSEPSPQRTPVLYQAGSSGRGRQFASRHAECVFIAASDPATAKAASTKLRQDFVNAGRQADDVKIFVGIAVVTGQTQGQAWEKYEEYLRYASAQAGVAHFSSSTGIDFSRFGLDEPISYGQSNAMQSASQTASQQGWTRRDLLNQHKLGSRYPTLVGDAREVADQLERWIDEGDIDGFNLSRIVVPETYEDFVDLVVPELQARGRYKTAYEPGTLRHKLFERGATLSSSHFASQWRHPHQASADQSAPSVAAAIEEN
ncbi:LLM class flavin-dependent oxidoreductase [Advenella incenata]